MAHAAQLIFTLVDDDVLRVSPLDANNIVPDHLLSGNDVGPNDSGAGGRAVGWHRF